MIILAHRGNLRGPGHPSFENSLRAVEACAATGVGIEIDVWAKNGRLYVSHDPRNAAALRDLERYLGGLKGVDRHGIALNVKSLDAIHPLEQLVRRHRLKGAFLFDLELVGAVPTSRRLHAIRVSDLPAEDFRGRKDLRAWRYLWVDEMDREWVTAGTLHDLKRKTRGKLLWVSPELHGRPYRTRWKQALRWPIDGICTDFPKEFQRMWSQR